MTISPPRPKGPHLNALRAFEAAARHGSFTLAATELCVTPGAVAQQVKSLEAWCGARLFKRQAHGISLTPLASSLLPEFTDAFDRLGVATQSLRAKASPNQVRIAALPSVAQLWLSPRLPDVRARHPDLEISVVATELPPNLRRDLFDLSIFFEDLPGDDRHIEISRDRIFPVCAPELARQLNAPTDLAGLTCLHDSSWTDDWKTWLEAACPGEIIETAGPAYSLYSLMLEEAVNGAGVMIGHEALVQAPLRSGELIAPFEISAKLQRRLAIAAVRPTDSRSKINEIVELLAG